MEYLKSNSRTSCQKGWTGVHANRDRNDNRELSKTGAMLLFNEAVPACASNRATCVDPPTSIVIEKLLPVAEEHSRHNSTKSSISFTALSEECLNAAVKLAKRDLRRRRLSPSNKFPQKHNSTATLLEMSDVEVLQELKASTSKVILKTSSPKEQIKHRSGHTSHHQPSTSRPRSGQSPLANEYSSQKNNPLDNEIYRLQKELEVCLQKLEEQASKEQISSEPLAPDEQSRLNNRKQKQEARSASTIYALQQQVKDLQENLQGCSQKTKSIALQRLAAAHRGALRALHGFIQQFSDSAYCTNPPNFKDLGQLIRQLCLCSAKVELNKGSAVPQTALSILQKLETLNSTINKQAMLKMMQVPTCLPPRDSQRGVNAFAPQAACKPINAAKNVKGKKKTSRKSKSVSYALTNRRNVLRNGVEQLVQQRELKTKDALQNPMRNKTGIYSKKSASLVKHEQEHISSLLQPTISSQLRVTHRPQREQSVPWIPTSPHSPPRQRPLPPKTRPEPRCLFPSKKSPQHQPTTKVTNEAMPSLNSAKKQQAQEESMRRVWLDKITTQKLKELEQLTEEDKRHLHLLRSKVISPTQCAEGNEQKATEIPDQAQKFGVSVNTTAPSLINRLTEHVEPKSVKSANLLTETLLDDLLEDTAQVAWALEAHRQLGDNAQHWTQSSTLENMLLRMDEIQRDQEQVRRRVTSIIYADPNWNKLQDSGKQSNSGPCSPQPIRLTKPVLRQSPAAEVILGKPLETGVLLEARHTEADVSEAGGKFPVAVQRSKGAVLSVPSHTLRSIQQYRERHETFCHSVALKTPGGVSPWAIADRLAEELLAEALATVAAEFQDAVEECAEAVFTSEFLQPVHSPTPSAQAIT